MNAVSMSTRSLKDILRKAAEKDLGFKVCIARDVPGPGGSVFIRAHTELTERHLSWLEQRNPARETAPTYVDVIFVQDSPASALPAEVESAAQPAAAAGERRRRSEKLSKAVVTRADNVVQQAREVFRIVGDLAFPPAALRNKKVQTNLRELNERILHFHRAVREALDEYLDGNTLIMDLIAQYGLGSRTVQHGLNAAVLATEIASLALLEEQREGEEFFASLHDEELLKQLGVPDPQAAELALEERQEQRSQVLKKDLAEVFLGGFMHDCGLWNEVLALEEGHEAAGARLIHSLLDIREFAPALTKILLFHSEAIRLANQAGIVQIIEYPDEVDRIAFRTEFYRIPEDAQAAIKLRHGKFQAEILTEVDLVKIFPVALAEYYLTQTEGFDAKPPPEVIGRLAGHAHRGLYLKFMVAMCNAQVEVIAPRRAYVELDGYIQVVVADEDGSRRPQRLEARGCKGCSIGHEDDMYSPHLIVLFVADADGTRRKLEYVDPRDSALWGLAVNPRRRMYIPGGRHRNSLTIRVTGFMSEEVYDNVLGEYEQELKRQMQA